jgi:hypothetical protein
MRRSILCAMLFAGLLILPPASARACLWDVATKIHEQQFKSSYQDSQFKSSYLGSQYEGVSASPHNDVVQFLLGGAGAMLLGAGVTLGLVKSRQTNAAASAPADRAGSSRATP